MKSPLKVNGFDPRMVPETEPPVMKLLPRRTRVVVAFSAGKPPTDNLDHGEEEEIPNLLFVSSQKKLALSSCNTLVAPTNNTEPTVDDEMPPPIDTEPP